MKRPLDTLASQGAPSAKDTQAGLQQDPLDLLEPSGHAQVYAAAAPTPRRHTRLHLAGAVAGAVLLVGLPTAYWLASLQGPRLFVPASPQGPAAGAQTASQREAWLRDVLASQAAMQAAGGWEPTQRNETLPGPTRQAQKAPEKASRVPVRGRGAQRPTTAPASAPQFPVDAPDPDYAALFGSASRYAQASAHPSSSHAGSIQDAARGRAIEGQLLHVRLVDEVVSQPVGAAVIAVLSRATKLGKRQVPAGAEVHGTVRGATASADRIFVNFGFVRLASGETFDVTGVARDVRGRQGITGRKRLDGRSAGSVGLASASRVAQAAGRQLAGAVGEVLGAGIEGASEAGRDKVRRLDQDEVVTFASPGTRFDIYVTAIDDKEK